MFRQKIPNKERVLATVLHLRKLCTQDTLAELFDVSRRTIGNVVREVGPLLSQDGYTPTPTTTRFTDAAAVLNSLPAGQDPTTPPT